MAEEMTSPEQRPFPETRPSASLESAVSPSPEEIKKLVEGSWADDWRTIKEKLVPEQIPKDQEGRILRTEAVVATAFPEASNSVRKIVLDVLKRQLDEAEISIFDTNVSLLPLARNLAPLVEKLEAKPPEPVVSEADRIKLQQFDLLDKAARGVGIEQGISGALSELQKTQRALGATQEVINKRVAEVLEKTKEIETLREKAAAKDQLIQEQRQKIHSLKAKLEKPPSPVTPSPPKEKPFVVAAENLSSNLKAIKAIDLLLHQGDLIANEKAKHADTQALLNEALSKYPDLESFRSGLQELIETRITVSREGFSEEEFRQAEKLKRQEYHQAIESLLTDLEKVYGVKERVEIPKTLFEKLRATNQLLSKENPQYRLKDRLGRPGGLIELRKDIPVILIPDIHARPDYLAQALLKTPEAWEDFLQGKLQIVCLGDGPHSENKERWEKAYQEYLDSNNYENFIGPATEEEMGKTFETMEMIMALKLLCPDNFHYLRGNHDDLTNKDNFYKFGREGEQTKAYVKAKFGEEFYKAYCQFEENLPIAARGVNFVAIHAEAPSSSTTIQEQIINYRENPKVSSETRWNRDVSTATIVQFLKYMVIPPNGYLIGGHSDREKNFYQSGGYISIGFREEHSSIAGVKPSGKVEIVNVSNDPHTAEELKRCIAEAIKKR